MLETLAIRPRPEKDELFSSWLVRLAAVNGAKLHTFTKTACPKETFWTRDIDRTASADALTTFEELAGLSEGALFGTTLRSYEGVLFEHHNMFGNTMLLLPLGIYHRVRVGHGLQYCPLCLEENGYFRKIWRIAVITLCSRHLVVLRDRCWRCSAPVLLHRSEQGMRGSFDATMRYKCFECGADLRRGRVYRTSWNSRIVRFQRTIEVALESGVMHVGNVPCYAHLVFAGMRIMMQKLATGRSAELFRTQASRHAALGDLKLKWDVGIRAIEQLDVHERAGLVNLVGHLISDWPISFLHIAKRAGLTASALLDYDSDVPHWYASVVRAELGSGSYVPSEDEIQSVINFLKRREVSITNTAIGRMLGNLSWSRKRRLSPSIRMSLAADGGSL